MLNIKKIEEQEVKDLINDMKNDKNYFNAIYANLINNDSYFHDN